MDNELMNISIENIKDLIYTIRGKQIMLDSDVAMLYHYETNKINETVKRNIKRFPEKFCFRLTKSEYEEILLNKPNNSSQIATSSTYKNRGISYLPNAFTEQGIGMLSGLKNYI
ncbi:MAG: ORF6N domain-containing protein [Oscillospiraceae bacterium]|nr:ORF6N domain-containing protein [Oscillospiraceae bacterium]